MLTLMDVIIDLKRIIFDRRIFMCRRLAILLDLTHFKCFFFESKNVIINKYICCCELSIKLSSF